MSKILTVVVPAYNAEKYLKNNLESFCVKEVLEDIEVLIINDGSTDQSISIAQEFVERYPNTFRVITKENGGHGSGINYGIRYAKGRYFKIIDADDWVLKGPFIKLVRALKTYEADIISSGFLWVYDNGKDDSDAFKAKAEINKPFTDVVYNKIYSFDEVSNKIYIKMHNMTIRTSIFREHDISIDEHCYYVDTEYITYPIPYVETICFVEGYVYMYRIGHNGQSINIEKMQKSESDYEHVVETLIRFYQKLGKQIPCSRAKKDYVAGIIARVVAGRIKIALSFPASNQRKKKLETFDRNLKTICPDIYYKNMNWAVRALRKSNYFIYPIACFLVRKRYLMKRGKYG